MWLTNNGSLSQEIRSIGETMILFVFRLMGSCFKLTGFFLFKWRALGTVLKFSYILLDIFLLITWADTYFVSEIFCEGQPYFSGHELTLHAFLATTADSIRMVKVHWTFIGNSSFTTCLGLTLMVLRIICAFFFNIV